MRIWRFGMSQDARDLRNAGLYLVASAVLAAGLVLGGAFFAERAIVNPAVAEIVTSAFAETGSSLETMPESMPTRLSVVVAIAREISRRFGRASSAAGPVASDHGKSRLWAPQAGIARRSIERHSAAAQVEA